MNSTNTSGIQDAVQFAVQVQPVRLLPLYFDKVWGDSALEPWFARSEKPVGEVWLASDANQTSEGQTVGKLFGHSPILAKLIFTSKRLSVQVHPDDRHALARGHARGKSELWHILRATPGAHVGIGLREAVTRERLREASLSGEILELIEWLPARAGDTFFVPAGVVHVIGEGLTLCEIQQNSDVTYRLYDYGRPRELHVDEAVAVASLEPCPQPFSRNENAPGWQLLAQCPYFNTELIELRAPLCFRPDPPRPNIFVFLAGEGTLGSNRFEPGQAWIIPGCSQPFNLKPDGVARLLRAYVPE